MNCKNYLENEKSLLEKAIAKDESLLEKLPEGSLVIKKNVDCYAWIQKNGPSEKKSKYIPKKERKLAEDLAVKGYVSAKLRDEKANLKATNLYLKHCVAEENTNKYLNRNAEYQKLLKPYLVKTDKNISDWLKKKYTGPVPHPENLRFMTQANYKVRSKSEQLIVSLLVKHGIPHKYEERLLLNGHETFPDFTIMNPRTHEEFIWEHLGMMDKYDYREHNLEKVEEYAEAGFYPGEKLILTFETVKSGFDEIWAEKLINHYLT